MAFKVGDFVRIKDIRNRVDYPECMRMCSGQTAHILRVTSIKYVDCGEEKSYYELDVDSGKGLWPSYFLEAVEQERTEDEWIDSVLKLISEIEVKLDQLKRQLWRKKKYGDR